jgi:hypothetical protein
LEEDKSWVTVYSLIHGKSTTLLIGKKGRHSLRITEIHYPGIGQKHVIISHNNTI